jgi:hypothetical protein
VIAARAPAVLTAEVRVVQPIGRTLLRSAFTSSGL